MMVISCATYGAIVIVSYIVMPSNPDKISITMNLIETFRVVSAGTLFMFWGVLGLIFGTLWYCFDPHNFEKITAF
jgi:predicted cobalt transporter CbtA